MKRSWIGFALLVVLLGIGLLVTRHMEERHADISLRLEKAAVCAVEEDWERARLLLGEPGEQWYGGRRFAACFADHAPMEDINGLFSQLEICAYLEEPLSFASICRDLAKKVEAVGEAHVPSWWNLL